MIFDAISRHQKGILSLDPIREKVGKNGFPKNGGLDPAAAIALAKRMAFGDSLPTMKEAGDLLIQEALARSRGNQKIAAMMLGITRRALNNRLHRKPDSTVK